MLSHVTCLMSSAYVDSWDMVNKFCFHVYAQKSLSHSHTLSISHSLTLNMLNNFCFHVYAQNSLVLAKIAMGFFGQPHHPHL